MSAPPPWSRRRRAGAAAALLVSGALALTAAAASSAAPHAGAAGTPACQTAGLLPWIELPGNGAAGSVVYTLHLTNLSGHKCTLRGFPGVSAINLNGRRVGRPAARDSSRRTRTVTLNRGADAITLLKIADSLDFPPSKCASVTAAGIRVFPPNQRASRTVPFPLGVCSKGPSNLVVQPVRRA